MAGHRYALALESKAKGWVGFMALGLRLKRVRNEKRVGLHADTKVRVSSSRVRAVMAAACQCKRLRYRKHTHTHTHTHPFNGIFFRDYPGEPVRER